MMRCMYLRQIDSGRWQASPVFRGRRATAMGDTRQLAQLAGARRLIEMGGTPGRAGKITVDELITIWFETSKLSITYRADCKSVVKRIPAPFLQRTLADVTPLIVAALYRQLAEGIIHPGEDTPRALSASRIRRIHTVLSSAWTLAQRYEWADKNPFAVAEKPPEPRSEARPVADAEIDAIILECSPELLLYIEVAETVGARRGELVALQWTDMIEVEVAGGDVEHAIVVQRSRSYAGGQFAITEGKSGPKGHRVVAIDPQLVAHLRTHRVEQLTATVAAGLPAPVWIFSDDAGMTPWHPEYPTKQFARARTAAGVDTHAKAHGLRHRMASRLLAAGVPLKVVQERLGHTRAATTMDRYGHYVPAADREASERMAAIRRSAPTAG